MREVRLRLERWIGFGAFCGALGALLIEVAYSCGGNHPWLMEPAERALLVVLDSGLEINAWLLRSILSLGGLAAAITLMVMLVYRPSRGVAVSALATFLFGYVAWVTALASFGVYTNDHRLAIAAGLLAPLLALPLTVWLRWPVTSLLLLDGGIALAVLRSTIFQHDFPMIVSPMWRFLPVAVLSFVAAWLLARRLGDATRGGFGRYAGLSGVLSVAFSSVLFLWVIADILRPRPAPAERIAAPFAYDLALWGDPPQMIWTDTEKIHIWTDPYAAVPTGFEIDPTPHNFPQRIWSADDGGLYIQTLDGISWWPVQGRDLARSPAGWLPFDRPMAFAEDPVARRLVMVSERDNKYAIVDRDSGERREGRLSDHIYGAWRATPELETRRVWLASAFGDGGLYELDLETLELRRKAALADLYGLVIDRAKGLIWGARILTGEVVALDTETFTVRHRIRTAFGGRSLERDPKRGFLYTCSWAGDVFRIDTQALTATTLGWCGRLCRAVKIDPDRDTLWITTDDGICRIPLAGR